MHGRSEDIFSFDTPKSLGEKGTMKEARGNFLTVAGLKSFNNGDGVCYIDEQGRLQGFRVNRVDGNKLYPQESLASNPVPSSTATSTRSLNVSFPVNQPSGRWL